jgi:CRP-like cAMP-binding protein
MAKKRKTKGKLSTDEIQIDLLKNILITQLGLAGVSQQNIRKIVGGDIGRVTAVMRHLKKSD